MECLRSEYGTRHTVNAHKCELRMKADESREAFIRIRDAAQVVRD